MKAACLLFLTISCAAPMHGTACGVPPDPGSQQPSSSTVSDHPRDTEHAASARDGKHQTNGKPSNQQRDRSNDSDTDHPRSRASLTKANPPKQLPDDGKRSMHGSATNLRQPDSNRSGSAAKEALMQNVTVNNALPVRSPSIVPHTGPSPNNLRHRNPNPATIGGLMTSRTAHIGVIDGTRMNRRP